MKINKISINLDKIKKPETELIIDYLKRKKIIIYPTDTIYGLGCDATDKKAVNKIFKIKKRPKEKPFIILASSLAMLNKYAYISRKHAKYIKTSELGPTTFILKSRKKLTGVSSSTDQSLAARLPKNDFLIKIIKKLNKPLISTSLNISGQKNIVNLENIDNYFKKPNPDLIIDAGILKTKKASRILDIRDMEKIKIIRS